MTFERVPDKDKRQWLKFISHYCLEKGWPPSIREIQEHFDVSSTSVVNYRIRGLVQLGYLDHTPYIARGIKVTQHGLAFMERR